MNGFSIIYFEKFSNQDFISNLNNIKNITFDMDVEPIFSKKRHIIRKNIFIMKIIKRMNKIS